MNTLKTITEILSSEDVKQKFISSWISHIWLFWSYARNEATKDSDLDLLIELDGNNITTIWKIQELEDLLVQKLKIKKVDFVTNKKLNTYLKPYIEKDLIHIF